MSNIQQGVNNILGTAALLGELSGKSGERREKKKLEKENEKITQMVNAPPKGKTIDPEYQNELNERYKKNLKRLFELNPNEKTYNKYDEFRAQEANRHSQSQTAAKKKQRRYFLEYLRKQPTSIGGTVGDLPISKQREIAKQYNRGDRKRMMDRMDKEDKDGKQK